MGGASELASVDTVSRDVAPTVPGTTVGGSNAHVVCGGRLPLAQLNVTGVLYGPPCGAIVTTCELVCPAASVTAGGETATVKFVTLICKATGSEYVTPLLAAATLIADAPNPHVIVEPGGVPHPPFQFIVVSAH